MMRRLPKVLTGTRRTDAGAAAARRPRLRLARPHTPLAGEGRPPSGRAAGAHWSVQPALAERAGIYAARYARVAPTLTRSSARERRRTFVVAFGRCHSTAAAASGMATATTADHCARAVQNPMLEGFQCFRVEPEFRRAALAVATAAPPASPCWRHCFGMSTDSRVSKAFYCGRLEAHHLQRTPPEYRSRYACQPPMPAALDQLARHVEALLALRGIALAEWAVLGLVQLTQFQGQGAFIKAHTDPRFYGEFLVTIILSSSRSSLELHAPHALHGRRAGAATLLERVELGAGDAYVMANASLCKARHQVELLGARGDDACRFSPPEPRFSATLRYYNHDMSVTRDSSGHSAGANHLSQAELGEPTASVA